MKQCGQGGWASNPPRILSAQASAGYADAMTGASSEIASAVPAAAEVAIEGADDDGDGVDVEDVERTLVLFTDPVPKIIYNNRHHNYTVCKKSIYIVLVRYVKQSNYAVKSATRTTPGSPSYI